MNTASPAMMIELRDQLEIRAEEFLNALPSHISPGHFQRAALTAIAQTPKLLSVDRRSLLNALLRCAQDGLIPDGRQAALVIFRDRERGEVAQYMPMVAGIRKLVQQGGEITRFEQVVVHANDKFEYRLGDHPHIEHHPAITDRGEPILVYSIAQFRDGTLSREVMTVEEIEKVRGASKYGSDGPWREWWSEMARKTIAKRHAKILPTANDITAAITRDNDQEFPKGAHAVELMLNPSERRPRLAERFDALAHHAEPAGPPRRGRRRNKTADAMADAPPPIDPTPTEDTPDMVPDIPESIPDELAQLVDEVAPHPDFVRGRNDALAGRQACLDRDIREAPKRYREWQRGFNSVKDGAA